MTEQQIIAVIESMTVPAREPETYLNGISQRSSAYHQRRRDRSLTRMSTPVEPVPRVKPAPTWYRMIYAESPEVVAGMPKLTESSKSYLSG